MYETASAPTTKIEIIQQAVALCGKQQTVNTVDGGGALAKQASMFFDTLVSAELGSNRWRFAQAYQQISFMTPLEPVFDGWTYSCELPADCIMVQAIYPNIDYIIFGDKILTKSKQNITLVYGHSVPVSKWPPTFSMYIVHHLAMMLGASVTNSDRMLARLSAMMKTWESRALFSDGQSTQTAYFRMNPYVDVRYRNKTRGY